MGLTFLSTILLYIGIICTTTGIYRDNVTMMVVGGLFVGAYSGIICYKLNRL